MVLSSMNLRVPATAMTGSIAERTVDSVQYMWHHHGKTGFIVRER